MGIAVNKYEKTLSQFMLAGQRMHQRFDSDAESRSGPGASGGRATHLCVPAAANDHAFRRTSKKMRLPPVNLQVPVARTPGTIQFHDRAAVGG